VDRKIKVNLIGGFLGSGKTTLLRHVLSQPLLPEKVALLVNEIGEVGIDGKILRRSGVDSVELANGCICCQISEDLVATLVQIADTYRPDRILIESTGVAEPGKVLGVLYMADALIERMRVDPTVIVIDAGGFDRLKRELAYHYVMQIKSADVILLNKIDLIDPKTAGRVEREVQKINPRAFIIKTRHCQVDLFTLLEGRPIGRPSEEDDHDDEVFESFVYESAGTFGARLEPYLGKLPANVFRVKGFVTLSAGRHLLNFVTGQTEIEPFEDGGRTNQLVVIGRRLDPRAERALRRGLDGCLQGGRPARNRPAAGAKAGRGVRKKSVAKKRRI